VLILGSFILAIYLIALLLLYLFTSAQRRAFSTAAIEAAIVTAVVVGVLGTLFVSQSESLDKAKQKRTVADLRNIGEALRLYQLRHSGYPSGTLRDLRDALVSEGSIAALPATDAWHHPYVYEPTGAFENDSQVLARHYVLRSAGKDGEFEPAYRTGPFEPLHYDSDIVIADSTFVRWPQKLPTRQD